MPAPHHPHRRHLIEAIDDVANCLFEGRLIARDYADAEDPEIREVAREYIEKAQILERRLDAARCAISAALRAA